MAEIVGGLFGVTPESLMAQREAALAQQAQNYAQLSPEQAAISGAYMTGGRLGSALGGLMGAQDPEMMRIQQRQSMLQNLDLTSPESLKQGIQQAMQNKDYQLVSELTNRYQQSVATGLKTRETEANIAAKLGEKLTPEQKNAAGLADAAGLQRGSQEWQDAYSKALSGLTNKNEPTAVVETADGVFLVNKVTGEKISRVGGAPQRGTNVSLSPEIKMANQELDWRKQFLSENKPVVDQGANVRQSLNLLGQTNSPFAQAAFNNTVVSAFGGDKQKSNAEIKRLANTGALDTRIANTLTNFFEGKNTATTVQDQQDVLNAVDKALAARYDSSSQGWKTRLKQAKVDPSMVVPSYEEVVGTKSAGGQTVNYQGAPASIVSQNADGTIVIEQNGVRKILAPKKQ